MFALRYWSVVILVLALAVGFFVWATTGSGGRFDFKLGLDLSSGTHLVYRADTSATDPAAVNDALNALRLVIERRINAFGVGEPIVEVQQGGALGGGEQRLIIELPGVTDTEEAIRRIGQTPTLEFKLVKQGQEASAVVGVRSNDPAFETTGLDGKLLSRASLQFENSGVGVQGRPVIRVDFNAEGTRLFDQITTNNIGRQLGIFLDGALLSAPVLQERIPDGVAIISGGSFTPESAKQLANDLNLGALPVPIELVSTQTIGATLGASALRAGLVAGIAGFVLLSIFMIVWYRLPGVVAVVSLTIYVLLMLALFKLIPVVLTAAGIAGFILSVGLAVDANVLIAERIKEELAAGKSAQTAIREGFARAWLAIRDSNIAHIIAAVILFWFGTSLIKGFALVFGLGVVVSMLSAITMSRTFLLALGVDAESRIGRFLLRSGLN